VVFLLGVRLRCTGSIMPPPAEMALKTPRPIDELRAELPFLRPGV